MASNKQKAELHKCFEEFMNDLYDYFHDEEKLNVRHVEGLAIKRFSERFNNTEVGKILGRSIRTVRYKKNGDRKDL